MSFATLALATRRDFLARFGAVGLCLAGRAPLRTERLTNRAQTSGIFSVPAAKGLTKELRERLRERGSRRFLPPTQQRYIGMPVGGVAAGQLYLSGDGRLWHWDVFDSMSGRWNAQMAHGLHYKEPMRPEGEELRVAQGFALRVGGDAARFLDGRSYEDRGFRGEYPVAKLKYRDDRSPVDADLEVFSPFVPLDAERSESPATVFRFVLHNRSEEAQEVELAAYLENAVCPDLEPRRDLRRGFVSRVEDGLRTMLATIADEQEESEDSRADIVFEDFEGTELKGWTVTGDAFLGRPIRMKDVASYQKLRGFEGKGFVNSHRRTEPESSVHSDQKLGELRSPEFLIQRDYIHLLVSGGRHPGKTAIELHVEGKRVLSVTGENSNQYRPKTMEVARFHGKKARLVLVDREQGPWGHIGVDRIVFSDTRGDWDRLEAQSGYGSMSLSVRGPTASSRVAILDDAPQGAEALFQSLGDSLPETRPLPSTKKAVGVLARKLRLEAGKSQVLEFIVAWHFPHYTRKTGAFAALVEDGKLDRAYADRFADAGEVAKAMHLDWAGSADATRTWNQTWYDSSLPVWLLDRSFIPIDCLATQTFHRFAGGRYWAWEGVDCCAGTCQHVWQYAQGLAHVFPSIERRLRSEVDFGIAFHESGALDYRAEHGRHVAHDGLCGTILRAWREHSLSKDSSMLTRLWPKIRKSIEFMIREDKDDNGILEGRQYNTLDAAWYGPMAWISSLYLAVLLAGERMAEESGDPAFAKRCRAIRHRGTRKLVTDLYNGEYFIHKPDPKHPEATKTGQGCHIDQLLGASFAMQLGLGRLLPEKETKSALRSLYRYNFTPDIGPYRKAIERTIPGGRWYALPGEAGLLMCTWPRGGADKAAGKGNRVFVGYFNECMTGFEYQVASHMIYEGLVDEGLHVAHAIDRRYAPEKRNPYNEIECSDHYSRAMASFGVFLAACGFEYHGPKGRMRFAPRLHPEAFRAPFLAAEGWGSFTQSIRGDAMRADLNVVHGSLQLQRLELEAPKQHRAKLQSLTLADRPVPAKLVQEDRGLQIALEKKQRIEPGKKLRVSLSLQALVIWSLLLLPLGLLGACEAGTRAPQGAEIEKPNFLFLFADDQRPDSLGCAGNPDIDTPNIDGLAAEGLRFTNNHCMGGRHGAVCICSRAMLMSGQHLPQVRDDIRGVTMLPELLREAGYHSFATGKWHNGKKSLIRAFDEAKNIMLGGMCDHTKVPVVDLDPVTRRFSKKRIAKRFSSALFADTILDFLSRQDVGKQPFFAYCAFTAPHDPRNPPVPYRKRYYSRKLPMPKNFMPQVEWFADETWSKVRDEKLAPWPRTEEVIRDQLAEYYGLITHLDEQIARILQGLEAKGLAARTVVIYTADHGLALGSHGLIGKQSIYEHSMGSPLILRGPGIPRGKTSDALEYIHDLFPTICELAGARIPDDVDALSLVPILRGEKQRVRETLFTMYRNTQRAVRDERFKLLVFPEIGKRFLFDLKTDPDELVNLIDEPRHAARLVRLERELATWQKTAGDKAPLVVKKLRPAKVDLTGTKRTPDHWQPKWIRRKYFEEGGFHPGR